MVEVSYKEVPIYESSDVEEHAPRSRSKFTLLSSRRYFLSILIVISITLITIKITFDIIHPLQIADTRGNGKEKEWNNHQLEIDIKSRIDSRTSIPHLLYSDLIMKKENVRSVFVIPEYKLIFITMPKIACTDWKRLLMRVNGNKRWCDSNVNVHNPKVNKLQTLADYPIHVATALLTSPSWTRATILREPKERLLSAFLDKCINDKTFFKKHCCDNLPTAKLRKTCSDNSEKFDNFLYFITHYKECKNPHWELMTNKIDEKWWPYIDFIGYQNNLVQDSHLIMKSLQSMKHINDGLSMWDEYGATGWGTESGCGERKGGFLEVNASPHNLGTASHMMEWYTPETEKIAEIYLAQEWQNPRINFPHVKLFP